MKALLSVSLSCALLLGALPASAETLFLKNGTQVTGKILKEDADVFVVENKDGRRKIAKADLEVLTPASPAVAATTGALIAGGGQFYQSEWTKGALFLGAAVLVGSMAYVASRQIRLTAAPGTYAVSAGIGYALPSLIGAVEAYRTAVDGQGKVRYRIEYGAAE